MTMRRRAPARGRFGEDALGFVAPAPSLAQGRTVTWKFTLDFLIQGPQAPFVIALEKGYYAKEGINLTMDRGFGSADAAAKVPSGPPPPGDAGFSFTAFINLKPAGARPDDIVAFLYSDYALPLYGNAVMVPKTLLDREPAAVRGFLKAFIEGVKDSINDPSGAIAAIKKRAPLINESVELERLLLALRSNVLTREVAADGFGGVRAERLARAIDAVAESFGLPTRPKWYEVFNGKFLPPKEDRMLPALR